MLGILVVAGISVAIRWPGFTQGGIANHDVGGILYNGMLLADGQLPYVNSMEFKAPGTFYLAWWLADGGTNIAQFQVWANVFAVCSLLGIASITWRLWGPASAVAAAAVYGLHDAHLDTMDANYVTWAQLPAVVAVGWALEAMRARQDRTRLVGFAIAGMVATWAVLLKRPAGAAVVVVVVMSLWRYARDGSRLRAGQRLRQSGAVVLGCIVGVLPIALHYTAKGHLGTLWDAFVLNRWGWRYASSGTQLGASDALYEGTLATLYFLALPIVLCAFAWFSPRNPEQRILSRVLAVWALLLVVSALAGFRFYKGYYLAALPPLCVMAVAPWGIARFAAVPAGLRRRWPQLVARVVLALPLLGLVGRQALLVRGERKNRTYAHDRGARLIAAQVRKQTQPGDKIWVWGWHLWEVYAYAERLSSTRFYKTMELTTSPNDSTWRRARSKLSFVDGPAAQELLIELRAEPPAYVVLGSAVPVRKFSALRRFLREHYTRDRSIRLNRVQFWKLHSDR